MFRLLTVQGGSVHVDMRFNFEKCYISGGVLSGNQAGRFIKLLPGKKPFLELHLKAVLRLKCGNFIRPDIPAKRIPCSRI